MAFIGIRITPEVGRLLSGIEVPGEKESPSEYHITMLYFGKEWPISKITKATEASYKVISKIEPFLVKTRKVSHFPPQEGQPIPIIAPVESDVLHQLQKKLRRSFNKAGVEYDQTFKEYHPHITLAYSEEKFDDFDIEPAVEFSVSEVVLWGGDHADDRIFITLPLKCPGRQKHSV